MRDMISSKLLHAFPFGSYVTTHLSEFCLNKANEDVAPLTLAATSALLNHEAVFDCTSERVTCEGLPSRITRLPVLGTRFFPR